MEKPIHGIKGKSVCVSVCVCRDVNKAQFGSDSKCERAGEEKCCIWGNAAHIQVFSLHILE